MLRLIIFFWKAYSHSDYVMKKYWVKGFWYICFQITDLYSENSEHTFDFTLIKYSFFIFVNLVKFLFLLVI